MLKKLVIPVMAALMIIASAILQAGDSRPKWLRFSPTHAVSEEGFRDVKWATRQQDIPWKWNTQGIPAACSLREDEDFHVFGEQARWITYTFRNSVLYGVRIDYEGKLRTASVAEKLRATYPPSEGPVVWNDSETSWSTKWTRIWVRLPEDEKNLGTIYLWGRNKVFPDDSTRPEFLVPPPSLLSCSVPYQPRYYVIYKRTSPVTIDGQIREKAWLDADWLDAFVDHQAPYAPRPWKTTRVKMIYDDEAIYVAAELQEENVWAHLTQRDSVIYYDNDFEIFLDPTADGLNYFEFELNALNTMFDMWHELDNHRGAYANPAFDSKGTRHAIAVNGTLNYHYDIDNGWTVEVRIPLVDLKEWNPRLSLPIKKGDLWRINFSRVQYLHVYSQLFPYLLPYSPCEDWVLQPTDTGDLHIPELWAKAVFSENPAGVPDSELENAAPKVLPTPPPAAIPRKGMVYFSAARIRLGPDPTDSLHSPAHQVDVPEFWMDRYEVTVAEYATFLNQGGHDHCYNPWMQIPERCGIIREGQGKYRVVPGRENYPVVYVTPEAALEYAESLGKTLPTEAMWERAARGTSGRTFPWGNEPIDPSRANYDFHYGGTTPVGRFPKGASPEGIYDLIGNVKEWTLSRFTPYPGGKPFENRWLPYWFDPVPENLEYWWVNRGGGWTKQEKNMVAAYRDGQGHMNVGFRCVKLRK